MCSSRRAFVNLQGNAEACERSIGSKIRELPIQEDTSTWLCQTDREKTLMKQLPSAFPTLLLVLFGFRSVLGLRDLN